MFGLRKVAQLFALFVEWGRGPATFKEVTPPRTQIEALVGESTEGYSMTIHCQERLYQYQYTRWFVRNRVVSSYYVFATIVGRAPPAMVEACSMVRSFPKLMHPWMPAASQKEAAIEAYIDLLLTNVQNGKGSGATVQGRLM